MRNIALESDPFGGRFLRGAALRRARCVSEDAVLRGEEHAVSQRMPPCVAKSEPCPRGRHLALSTACCVRKFVVLRCRPRAAFVSSSPCVVDCMLHPRSHRFVRRKGLAMLFRRFVHRPWQYRRNSMPSRRIFGPGEIHSLSDLEF